MPESRAVDLVEMTDAEHDVFVAESYVDYLNRMVAAHRWTAESAQQRIDALMASAPVDRQAAGQRFYRAVGNGQTVGSVWLQLDADVMFVMQITILPTLRGQGWGRATMREVERMARLQGSRRMALNVFFDNAAAMRLYDSEGYSGILQQMVKRLD